MFACLTVLDRTRKGGLGGRVHRERERERERETQLGKKEEITGREVERDRDGERQRARLRVTREVRGWKTGRKNGRMKIAHARVRAPE